MKQEIDTSLSWRYIYHWESGAEIYVIKLKIDHERTVVVGSELGRLFYFYQKNSRYSDSFKYFVVPYVHTNRAEGWGIKQTKKYFFWGGSVIFEFVAASVKKKLTTARRLED